MHTTADLDYALRKFWELEAIGMNNDTNGTYTPAEKDAMAKVAISRRYADGRYEVGIPWIQEEIKLENNHMLAWKRLKNLERYLQRKSEVARKYNEMLSSHMKKGYIRKLTPEESMVRPKWFLLHCPVDKVDLIYHYILWRRFETFRPF